MTAVRTSMQIRHEFPMNYCCRIFLAQITLGVGMASISRSPIRKPIDAMREEGTAEILIFLLAEKMKANIAEGKLDKKIPVLTFLRILKTNRSKVLRSIKKNRKGMERIPLLDKKRCSMLAPRYP